MKRESVLQMDGIITETDKLLLQKDEEVFIGVLFFYLIGDRWLLYYIFFLFVDSSYAKYAITNAVKTQSYQS